MKNEAQARLKINKLLEVAGWRFFDDKNERANIQVESNAKIESLGDDFEHIKQGFIDYLLLDKKGFPLCVLEAKKEAIHPLSAKEQARRYAQSKNCRFVILSNGNSHYLWDLEKGNPEIITTFPAQESLEHRKDYKHNIIDLADKKVTEDYLEHTKKLRYYQLEAVHALQNAAKNGKERFLFEMATGTGKTFLSAAVCKLFLKTGNAKRILFLVDRIELENQAVKSFREVFKGQYFIDTIKSKNWQHCQIIVSTVQTLLAGNRYRELFSPIDFELVISDEAHRLGVNSRAVFEYFIGFKLGLTATPKDFFKGIDEADLENKNIKALEQRNLKDTYKTFGCEDGNPTYRYDLKKGVEAGFLLNPKPIDARTDITTKLLSEKGYDVKRENEDGEQVEVNFKKSAFERKFVNEETNRVFCKCLLENGLKDPFTGEFGKTLVFCVSQNHAAKITQILNKLANKKWQGKYNNSDFAVQVTSDVQNSGQHTKDFSANKLLGKSIFGQEQYPDYETSKARVCVTVGMMTTGYDCPDLLNVVLMKPIFSPYEFIQMKGRGTRKHDFLYQETNETKAKQEFLLLDFFANCEYFEEDFDYAKQIKITISNQTKKDDAEIPPKKPDRVDLNKDDAIKTETIIYIGEEGMKIDNKLYPETYQQFEYVIKENEKIQKINQEQGIDAVQDFIKKYVFNSPTEYWTAAKIRKSYEKKHKTERKITLEEMLSKALGLQEKFKNRQERLDELYDEFIIIEKPTIDISQQDIVLKRFFENYLSNSKFREIIDNKTFADLHSYAAFGIEKLETIKNLHPLASSYIKEYLTKEMAEFEF